MNGMAATRPRRPDAGEAPIDPRRRARLRGRRRRRALPAGGSHCCWSRTCIWRRAPPTRGAASSCRPMTAARRWRALAAVLARSQPRARRRARRQLARRAARWSASTPDDLRDAARRCRPGRDWLWLTGNHDPDPPPALGGDRRARARARRRHPAARADAGERGRRDRRPPASGRQGARCAGARVRRRCFAADGRRCVMPAFGAYAGGLNVLDARLPPAVRAGRFTAHMLGARAGLRRSGLAQLWPLTDAGRFSASKRQHGQRHDQHDHDERPSARARSVAVPARCDAAHAPGRRPRRRAPGSSAISIDEVVRTRHEQRTPGDQRRERPDDENSAVRSSRVRDGGGRRPSARRRGTTRSRRRRPPALPRATPRGQADALVECEQGRQRERREGQDAGDAEPEARHRRGWRAADRRSGAVHVSMRGPSSGLAGLSAQSRQPAMRIIVNSAYVGRPQVSRGGR